ncbi:hypothetical protein VP1G_00187 [Cytospora mali]|uniref:Uncharacterized protein n=1 Tax=Cytospora mali TaxID=578113 RepID=A0A194UMF8_CYTMA|nr:hypothetical protein VP1G_00187 [Valsa mali var. pyri (nom. inval.)]
MASKEEARTYMEEADEDGNPIDDTRTYVSAAPSVKKEANVSRTRKEKMKRKDSSSPATTNLHTDSDSTTHLQKPPKRESKKPKEKSRDKDRDRSLNRKTVTYGPRPGPKSSKTLPNIHTSSLKKPHEQPSHYGVSPTGVSPILMAAASNSTRPRAYTANPRPTSYYGPSSRPPPASARYFQHPYPAPGTSYPPQSLYPPAPPPPPSVPQYQSPFPPPSPMGPPQDYFSPNLSSRFDYHRPQSAMARPARPAIAYGPEYDDLEEGGVLIRQPSLTRRRSTRRDEDRIRMPPQRPNTTRPHSTAMFEPPSFKRQPVEPSNESLYDDESVDEDDSLYDMSPPDRYDYRPHPVRRPSIDSTVVYDMGPRYTEIAGRRSRRNSFYGSRNKSTERDVQEKYQTALRYQEDLVDGQIDPLTADSLRRFAKTPNGGTRSSDSRDESGYGRSNGTTRNTVDNEDMTILVKGTGSLSFGNALLDIKDGAEINIRTGGGGGGGGSDRNSHGDSDNTSSAYDDHRTRFERPFTRGRADSQSPSHSRSFPFQPQPQFAPPSSADYHGNSYTQMPMQYAPPYPYPYHY